jgi:hypothetical protein
LAVLGGYFHDPAGAPYIDRNGQILEVVVVCEQIRALMAELHFHALLHAEAEFLDERAVPVENGRRLLQEAEPLEHPLAPFGHEIAPIVRT